MRLHWLSLQSSDIGVPVSLVCSVNAIQRPDNCSSLAGKSNRRPLAPWI